MRVPTVVERKDILNALFRKLPHALEAEHIEHLASATHGFVGADLFLLCSESSLAAAKRITTSSESFFTFLETTITYVNFTFAVIFV
jgi:SpoVK/Ycf46/Vps4 family AAA+-type ATPase